MRHSSMAEAASNGASLLEAARRRLELWDLSRAQIDEIERTGKPVKSITIYSPASGYVGTRNAFASQRVTPETELYTITDLSRVWVMADVFEADAPQMRVGQGARVTLPGGVADAGGKGQLSAAADRPRHPHAEGPAGRAESAHGAQARHVRGCGDAAGRRRAGSRCRPTRCSIRARRKTVFLDRGNGLLRTAAGGDRACASATASRSSRACRPVSGS